MNKRSSIAAFLLLLVSVVQFGYGQKVETIELIDGSIIEGYVSRQDISKGFTFEAFQTQIVLPSRYIDSRKETLVRKGRLSEEWREWAENHESELQGDKLALEEIIINPQLCKDQKESSCIAARQLPSDFGRVKVLNDSEVLNFICMAHVTFELEWADIKKQTRDNPDPSRLNGIEDVIGTKDNDEYSGTIVEQKPGKEITILQNNGNKKTLQSSRLSYIKKQSLDNSQSILSQSPLLEKVVMKNGEVVEGLIIEQTLFSNQNEKTKLVVEQEDGTHRSIAHSDVREILRVTNPLFKPTYEITLGDNEFLLNEQKVKFVEFSKKKKTFYTNEISNMVKIRQSDINGEVVLLAKEKSSFKNLVVVEVDEVKVKGQFPYGFSEAELDKNAVEASEITISPTGVMTIPFNVSKKGCYAIYNANTQLGILFRII